MGFVSLNAQQECTNCETSSGIPGTNILGSNNAASGSGSILIGHNVQSTSNGGSGIVIGKIARTMSPNAIVIGTGVPNSMGEDYFLSNNKANSLMVGFNSPLPTFFVSPAPSSFENDRTGRIGIGNITLPQAKLHIRSDGDEDANILLDVAGWESGKTADIYFGGLFNRISSGYGNGIEFYTENKFYFENGPIGVGTSEPQAMLHLYAQEGETASIFLEPEYWGAEQMAAIALGNNQHRIKASFEDGLVFNSASNFLFIDGKVGIGAVTNPSAKLHIKSAENEDASILIEPFRFETEGSWQASLFLGDMENGVIRESSLGMVYHTTQNHIFQGGKVGIGTIEPTALFHVEDAEGFMKYSNAELSISSKGNVATLSIISDEGPNWDIINHSGHRMLYFQSNLISKMGISNENGLWVDEQIAVCDLQGGTPYPFPDAGIHVIQDGLEEDEKGAEFCTKTGGRLFLVPKCGDNGHNQLTQPGDVGVFWSNTTGTSDGGRLIIAPHNSRTSLASGMIMCHGGNVGIGIEEPSARLDVKSSIQVSGWNNNGYSFAIKSTSGDAVFAISPSGETKIASKLWAQEIEVVADVWSDFVFAESYKLKPLEEVEDFILENNHLPDVPSEKEIKEDGLNLGEMDAILLQKIEELTLYIIEQDKKIDELNERIEDLSDDK